MVSFVSLIQGLTQPRLASHIPPASVFQVLGPQACALSGWTLRFLFLSYTESHNVGIKL